MSNSKQKLTCPLLYNHVAYDNFGNQVFCCITGYSESMNSRYTMFDSKYQFSKPSESFELKRNKAREDFKNGKFPKECEYCRVAEEVTNSSFRLDNIYEFPETTEKALAGEEPSDIEYMDIKLGNTCNLKCRMCNPYASAALTKEYEEIYPGSSRHSENSDFDWYKNSDFFDSLYARSSKLKLLHFTGGEPFIIKEMWEYIDKLIADGLSSNITLRFNTNFTVFNEEIFDRLLKFKETRLILSLDGVGENFEYIRFPGKWKTVEDNLKLLNELSSKPNNIQSILSPAIQTLNVFDLKNIIHMLDKFENLTTALHLNKVTHPQAYSIANLPKRIKAELKMDILSNMTDIPKNIVDKPFAVEQLKGLIGLLNEDGDPEELKEFLRINAIYDKSRNQNLKDILPEGWMEQIMDTISKR